MITVQGNILSVKTRTLEAVFTSGVLTSLKNDSGRQLISADEEPAPLHLVYAQQELMPLAGMPGDQVTCISLGESRAEIRFNSWNGDGCLAISEDLESGDLVVEPSASTSRPGVRAVRWLVPGVARNLELVAPFFQGIRMPLDHPLLRNTHWHWPHFWEAGMAILQGAGGGFWLHCQDDRFRYKALQVGIDKDPHCLGLESETYGPLDGNISAGGLAWRINVYDGDWKAPAKLYRDWLRRAYSLDGKTRPDWLASLRLAISWCPTDVKILESLSRRFDPRTVLIHLPHWRSDVYDQNYPTFQASAAGRKFVARAQALGFQIMPHMNAIDMDPKHPVYNLVRDFQYRHVETKRVEGWTYHEGKILPVPESNVARLRHQDKNTMAKIHPGLSAWRGALAEHVQAAVKDLSLDLLFLDVTLNTWNLHNCLVENMTPTEGMCRLIHQVAALKPGLAVGGEGRTEMTMIDQSLGQVHLFKSWSASAPGLETLTPCPINEFLFGQWCRSFGYAGLAGKDTDQELRMSLHEKLGAVPTLTIGSVEELETPTPAVKNLLERE